MAPSDMRQGWRVIFLLPFTCTQTHTLRHTGRQAQASVRPLIANVVLATVTSARWVVLVRIHSGQQRGHVELLTVI